MRYLEYDSLSVELQARYYISKFPICSHTCTYESWHPLPHTVCMHFVHCVTIPKICFRFTHSNVYVHTKGLTVSLYVGCRVRLAIFVFCLVVLVASGLRYIFTYGSAVSLPSLGICNPHHTHTHTHTHTLESMMDKVFSLSPNLAHVVS